MNNKTNFWNETAKAGYIELLFTSFPTLIILSIFITISNKNLLFLTIPFIFVGVGVLFKPLSKCEICNKPIQHEVKGLFDFHIQCDCVKGRWRPIWYLWFENIHNKIFRKGEVTSASKQYRTS